MGAQRLRTLTELGADVVVALDEPGAKEHLGEAAKEADVVLDYLWGQPTADALYAIVPERPDDRPLTWVQIGSVAGPECPIPSAAVRATRLQIVGSGHGSVPTRDVVAELAALATEIATGTYAINAHPLPLAAVEQAWAEAGTAAGRIVIVP